VIVELKQWDKCETSEADKLVRSWVGGRERELLHPSVQVGQYRQYLEDSHTAFHEGPSPVRLASCSYLHNYVPVPGDPILAPKFDAALLDSPLFDGDKAEALAGYLRQRLSRGTGRAVLDRIEQSRYRPSRKLMDHVSTAIKSRSPWVLLEGTAQHQAPGPRVAGGSQGRRVLHRRSAGRTAERDRLDAARSRARDERRCTGLRV